VVKKTWPSIYGATFVRALLYRTETVHLGVGYTGIHVIHGKDGDKKHTSTFAFEDIAKWTLDARQHEFEFELMRDGQSQECVRVGAKYCARMFRPRRRRAASLRFAIRLLYFQNLVLVRALRGRGRCGAARSRLRRLLAQGHHQAAGAEGPRAAKERRAGQFFISLFAHFFCLLILFCLHFSHYCFVCTFLQTLKEENTKAAASLEDALQSEKERQRAKLQLLLRQRRASVSGLTAPRASAIAHRAPLSGGAKRFAATASSLAVAPSAAANGEEEEEEEEGSVSSSEGEAGEADQMMFPSVASFATPIVARGGLPGKD
jgi:hypothetical protein